MKAVDVLGRVDRIDDRLIVQMIGEMMSGNAPLEYRWSFGDGTADLPWSEAGIEGCGRCVQRLWRLFDQYDDAASGEDKALARKAHQTIAAVADDIEALVNFYGSQQ